MYSDTIREFHPAPHAVMLPVRIEGTIAGRISRFQYANPRSPKARAASWRSPGMARTPAITLNRRYHCIANRAIRNAASSDSAPTEGVSAIAKPRISGSRAVAGIDANTSITGVRTRDARALRPMYTAMGIVQAKDVPYASARRARERRVASGIPDAAGGRGRRSLLGRPASPGGTRTAKINRNIARSVHRIPRIDAPV